MHHIYLNEGHYKISIFLWFRKCFYSTYYNVTNVSQYNGGKNIACDYDLSIITI